MGELAVSRAFGDSEFKKGVQVRHPSLSSPTLPFSLLPFSPLPFPSLALYSSSALLRINEIECSCLLNMIIYLESEVEHVTCPNIMYYGTQSSPLHLVT
jgi:hypothetical protein